MSEENAMETGKPDVHPMQHESVEAACLRVLQTTPDRVAEMYGVPVEKLQPTKGD